MTSSLEREPGTWTSQKSLERFMAHPFAGFSIFRRTAMLPCSSYQRHLHSAFCFNSFSCVLWGKTTSVV